MKIKYDNKYNSKGFFWLRKSNFIIQPTVILIMVLFYRQVLVIFIPIIIFSIIALIAEILNTISEKREGIIEGYK